MPASQTKSPLYILNEKPDYRTNNFPAKMALSLFFKIIVSCLPKRRTKTHTYTIHSIFQAIKKRHFPLTSVTISKLFAYSILTATKNPPWFRFSLYPNL